ncbi:hypothetical protein ES731_07280 [Psychroflexus gondwanensis]|uniref:DUF6913 domain-containing protein n=1 Tax=Psychroflexus gondwanensis TaxID=251 RepID=UPI0011BE0A0A|nr:hypothetical protein [Psychroflexus gondwanensis]TXE19836.1 hypothetical protein ES731_07280 [Psychroflexus gondwanensis]
MLNSIKTHFLHKSLSSKRSILAEESVGDKVGILYNDDIADKYQLEQLVEKNFKINSEDISFLGFSRHRYDKVEKPEYVFTTKDFTLFGKPKSKAIDEFLKTNYKLLFNYFGKDELCLEVLALLTEAKLKVGFQEANERVNDLILNVDSKNLDFFKESSKYIKQII